MNARLFEDIYAYNGVPTVDGIREEQPSQPPRAAICRDDAVKARDGERSRLVYTELTPRGSDWGAPCLPHDRHVCPFTTPLILKYKHPTGLA